MNLVFIQSNIIKHINSILNELELLNDMPPDEVSDKLILKINDLRIALDTHVYKLFAKTLG